MVLAELHGGMLLYEGEHGLRMCWCVGRDIPWPPKHDFPAQLTNQGDWTRYGYRQRPTGGTGMQALAQLIRYVRDLPRLPLVTWEYWAGDTVQLATPRALEILRASDYGNPKKTCCVLCGDPHFKRGLDWWSLDRVVGPACYGGNCQKEEAHGPAK
jgi:hypothetical protein